MPKKTTVNNEPSEVIEENVKVTKKESKTVKKETKIGKVSNCERLNVREEARPDANIVRTIESGKTVEILEEVFGYYRISDGFLAKDYVEVV